MGIHYYHDYKNIERVDGHNVQTERAPIMLHYTRDINIDLMFRKTVKYYH